MAKFDKDDFIRETTAKVKDAIASGLITQEDVDAGDKDRLEGFLQYYLADYITDRKTAISILSDFNFDERYDWDVLSQKFNKFTSLTDIALADIWMFLVSQGMTDYAYYTDGQEYTGIKKDDELETVDYDDDEFDDVDTPIEDAEEDAEDEDFEDEDDLEDFDDEDFDATDEDEDFLGLDDDIDDEDDEYYDYDEDSVGEYYTPRKRF